jgi:hypothetical protein
MPSGRSPQRVATSSAQAPAASTMMSASWLPAEVSIRQRPPRRSARSRGASVISLTPFARACPR